MITVHMHVVHTHAIVYYVREQDLERSGSPQYLAPCRRLFSDYLALSHHSYATVRAEAQAAVERCAQSFGYLLSEHLPDIVARFAGQASRSSSSGDGSSIGGTAAVTHAGVTGDLYLM